MFLGCRSDAVLTITRTGQDQVCSACRIRCWQIELFFQGGPSPGDWDLPEL